MFFRYNTIKNMSRKKKGQKRPIQSFYLVKKHVVLSGQFVVLS